MLKPAMYFDPSAETPKSLDMIDSFFATLVSLSKLATLFRASLVNGGR